MPQHINQIPQLLPEQLQELQRILGLAGQGNELADFNAVQKALSLEQQDIASPEPTNQEELIAQRFLDKNESSPQGRFARGLGYTDDISVGGLGERFGFIDENEISLGNLIQDRRNPSHAKLAEGGALLASSALPAGVGFKMFKGFKAARDLKKRLEHMGFEPDTFFEKLANRSVKRAKVKKRIARDRATARELRDDAKLIKRESVSKSKNRLRGQDQPIHGGNKPPKSPEAPTRTQGTPNPTNPGSGSSGQANKLNLRGLRQRTQSKIRDKNISSKQLPRNLPAGHKFNAKGRGSKIQGRDGQFVKNPLEWIKKK